MEMGLGKWAGVNVAWGEVGCWFGRWAAGSGGGPVGSWAGGLVGCLAGGGEVGTMWMCMWIVIVYTVQVSGQVITSHI